MDDVQPTDASRKLSQQTTDLNTTGSHQRRRRRGGGGERSFRRIPPLLSGTPAMETPPEPSSTCADVDAPASAVWDLESFLDFTIDEGFTVNPDDPLILSWAGSEDAPAPQDPPRAAEPSPSLHPPLDAAVGTPPEAADGQGRVRKRDVRLVCPNYLAGRVPCACPEEDEMAAEDEEVAEIVTGGRKRARTGGAAAAAARCQVPGCEADISELKGYHKRHRVCLRCANAPSVVLDGEQKRYCQQCGKFHILPDFDEGKRSCRRKLERHNKRRRRRPTDSRSLVEKEAEAQDNSIADDKCDGERRDEITEYACDTIKTVAPNKTLEGNILFGSEDGRGSPVDSQPSLRTDQSNSSTSNGASDEAKLDDQTIKFNKSTYSSVCPTGRISFKLYDWNPAEFPRRLRHQIFQWLANMPVELEGYIRPGCTILTVFISMPQFMWDKLYQDTADCVRGLLNAPDSLLLGRGTILIYLGNMIVQVLKDGTSLMNVKMEVHAPRLHYVYPTYFESGKPMELVACGSNLEQPKLRFLVSFAGRYLKYDCSRVKNPGNTKYPDGNVGEHICDSEHEVYKIKIAQADTEIFGPAFVEVENISGISNFIPIIVGSASICSEIKKIEDSPEYSCFTTSIVYENAIFDSGLVMCEVLKQKQTALSALLLDIAWLLKEHHVEEKEPFLNLNNVQKITCVLQFLLRNEFFSIIEVIIHRLDNITSLDGVPKTECWTSNDDLMQFHEYIELVRDILYQKNLHGVKSEVSPKISRHGILMPQNNLTDVCTIHPANKDNEVNSLCSTTPKYAEEDVNDPLLAKTNTHRQHCFRKLSAKSSWDNIFPTNITRSYLALFVMVSVTMCLMACVVLLHPHAAGEFVVSIRRCMFGGPMR